MNIYDIFETKKGLYYNVNKRKRAGTSRSKNASQAPSAQDWKNAAKTAKEDVNEGFEIIHEFAEDTDLFTSAGLNGVDRKSTRLNSSH